MGSGAINGYKEYGGGAPNQYNLMAAAVGAFKGIGENISGAGVADIAKNNLGKLENAFKNLGDNAYRMCTAGSRKDVIKQMNNYIKSMQDRLNTMQLRINNEMKSNTDFFITISKAYASGIITKDKYGKSLQTYKNGLNTINFMKKTYKEFQTQYQPLIDDANTIIKVNK